MHRPALFLVMLSLTIPAPPQTHPAPKPLLVGYFGQWGVYDGILPKFLVTSGAASVLDQINYAQGFVSGGHCSVADPNADLHLTLAAADSLTHRADAPQTPFRGNLHQLAELKRLHPHLKLLISLEGKADDFAFDARPENRAAFVSSCVDIFLRGHLAPGVSQPRLFDGIDLDWEYPHGDDAANFLALVTDLRHAMSAVRPGLRLSIAVGATPRMYEAVNIPAVAAQVDQVGVMNYDYHGPWNPSTDFIAPLYTPDYTSPGGPANPAAVPHNPYAGSVARSLDEWQAAGVPAPKLLLGLPFYGYGWQQVAPIANGYQQPGKAIRGDRPYSFFATLLTAARTDTPEPTTPAAIPAAEQPPTTPARRNTTAAPTNTTTAATKTTAPPAAPSPFTLYRDPRSQAPWLYDGSTFWTFEDPTSIRAKAAFARDHHLAGAMIWELGNDTPTGDLVHAAHQGLNPAASPAKPHRTTRPARPTTATRVSLHP